MDKKLVCDECRAAMPSLLSCIHTFPPRIRKSSIVERDLAEEKKEAVRQAYFHEGE
jgi:hypothetical protein